MRRLGDAIGGMLPVADQSVYGVTVHAYAWRRPGRRRLIHPPRTAESACGGQSAAWANLRA
jgi:hypothetical protein